MTRWERMTKAMEEEEPIGAVFWPRRFDLMLAAALEEATGWTDAAAWLLSLREQSE